MPRKSLPVLVMAGLLLSMYAAHAFGLGKEGRVFSKLGAISGKIIPYGPATACSGTGLIFTVACNSQYIGTL